MNHGYQYFMILVFLVQLFFLSLKENALCQDLAIFVYKLIFVAD